jgi:hypothetical protein
LKTACQYLGRRFYSIDKQFICEASPKRPRAIAAPYSGCGVMNQI